MTAIKIAEILIQRRREKGITQEELAEYMGVSKAAVSKWEKEQSYPDITLLPQLAAYFKISVDELIGYAPQLTREEIKELCLKLSADFTTKPFNEVMAECREIIKTHFSCFSLLYHMAVLLINYSASAGDEENKKELLNEVKFLCKRVISESGDVPLAKDALDVLCIACIWLKEPEDVFSLLGDSLRPTGLSEADLISQAYELTGNKEKATEISQCGMYEFVMLLVNSIATYISLSYESSFESAKTAHERLMEFILLFNVEELASNEAAKAYLMGVEMYCKHNQVEKALKILNKYADLCCKMTFPLKVGGDTFFTAVEQWLDDSEIGATIPFSEEMIKPRLIDCLTELPSLAVLHDEQRYKDILQRITDFTNK